jgi:RecG-like helicase
MVGMNRALDSAVETVEEWFEPALLKKHVLMPRCEAYRAIHRPADMRDAMRARRPDMAVAHVPDRGHVPFLDEPEAQAVIAAFIGQLG